MMKKFFALLVSLSLFFSVAVSTVYAGGDKNHGSKGQGSTGTSGGGAATQTRGN